MATLAEHDARIRAQPSVLANSIDRRTIADAGTTAAPILGSLNRRPLMGDSAREPVVLLGLKAEGSASSRPAEMQRRTTISATGSRRIPERAATPVRTFRTSAMSSRDIAAAG